MFQPQLLGKFLHDSYVDVHSLSSHKYYQSNISYSIGRVHSIMSLLIQASYQDLITMVNKMSNNEKNGRIHPLDIILYYIQRSSDEEKNIIFDSLLKLNIALPLAINDHIYPEYFHRQKALSLRNDRMKLEFKTAPRQLS